MTKHTKHIPFPNFSDSPHILSDAKPEGILTGFSITSELRAVCQTLVENPHASGLYELNSSGFLNDSELEYMLAHFNTADGDRGVPTNTLAMRRKRLLEWKLMLAQLVLCVIDDPIYDNPLQAWMDQQRAAAKRKLAIERSKQQDV